MKPMATISQAAEAAPSQFTTTDTSRLALTKPCKGVHNEGYDNAEHDYICRVGGKIVDPENNTHEIEDRFGAGVFGQVMKCNMQCVSPNHDNNKKTSALKMIKQIPAYSQQALEEISILKMLNEKYDPEDNKGIVRMLDYFVFRKHVCIAFQALSMNLNDLLARNDNNGLSTKVVSSFTKQLFETMQCFREANLMHCDLKTENVMIADMRDDLENAKLVVIDFGLACFQDQAPCSLQSLFYRAPEVLLDLRYTTAIDMWGVGCISAELFMGRPLFAGQCEHEQVSRIVTMQGLPSAQMLDAGGAQTWKYFQYSTEISSVDSGDSSTMRLKTREEYEEENEESMPEYESPMFDSLKQIMFFWPHCHHILTRTSPPTSMADMSKEEKTQAYCLLQLLRGVLQVNPDKRWTPLQALGHPFVSGAPHDPKFVPIQDEPVPSFMERGYSVRASSSTHFFEDESSAESYRPHIDELSNAQGPVEQGILWPEEDDDLEDDNPWDAIWDAGSLAPIRAN